MTDLYPFLLILMLLAAIALALFISARMTKRAVSQVINIFRKKNAIGIRQAKTLAELGLTPPTFVEKLGRLRDYKQNALNLLLKAQIIHLTDEGKLFITEEKLNELILKGVVK